MWDKYSDCIMLHDMSGGSSLYYQNLLDNANNNNSLDSSGGSPAGSPPPSSSTIWELRNHSNFGTHSSSFINAPVPKSFRTGLMTSAFGRTGGDSSSSSNDSSPSPTGSPPRGGGVITNAHYRPLAGSGSIMSASTGLSSPTHQSPYHCDIFGLSCPYAAMLRTLPKLSSKVNMLSCFLCCQGERNHGDEEGGTTDTATTENSNKHEKDSGVSTKDNESSEQEILDNECCVSPGGTVTAKFDENGCHMREGSDGDDLHCSNDSFTSSNDTGHGGEHCTGDCPPGEISAEDCQKFRAVLETRCHSNSSPSNHQYENHHAVHHNSHHHHHHHHLHNSSSSSRGSAKEGGSPSHRGPRSSSGERPLQRKDSQSSIEREIAALNHEMEQIQLECQEIVDMHSRQGVHPNQGPVPALGNESSPVSQLQHRSPVKCGTTEASVRSPRMVPRMGTRLDYIRQLHAMQHEHCSSGSGTEPSQWLYQRAGHPNVDANGHVIHPSTDMNGHIMYPNPPAGQPGLILPPPPPPLRDNSYHSPEKRLAHGSLVDRLKEKEKVGDTSGSTSAYNTGDSCRSTPLTLELHPDNNGEVIVGKNNNSTMLCLAAPMPLKVDDKVTNNAPVMREWTTESGDNKRGQSVSRMSQTAETLAAHPHGGSVDNKDSLQDLYAQYADVMYTNRENLQHTIMVQQKLFQQQLMQKHAALQQQQQTNNKQRIGNGGAGSSSSGNGGVKAVHNNATTGNVTPPATGSRSPAAKHSSPTHRTIQQNGSKSHDNSPVHNGNAASAQQAGQVTTSSANQMTVAEGSMSGAGVSGADIQMEYVVKRRADGTRYIARRPVRNKLLKERAKKINEERCGMTTDDDAMSEMKVGRYWNKMERKRHLEKSRQRKEKVKAKMETLKEAAETEGHKDAGPNIVDLSHRKMMKHKGKKVFDDFTTIQEMMAHGNTQSGSKSYNPLLSVTTV